MSIQSVIQSEAKNLENTMASVNVDVHEILPPFGRLNDTLCKQVYCPFLIPLLRGVGVCNTHLHSFFLCHSERSEESGYINFVFTDPSLRSG